MFETAAAAVGATVVPAGIGQTELQAQAVASLKVTAYAGTPDYLKAILEKGEELGLECPLSQKRLSAVDLYSQL